VRRDRWDRRVLVNAVLLGFLGALWLKVRRLETELVEASQGDQKR
jgi:hypothetical protein